MKVDPKAAGTEQIVSAKAMGVVAKLLAKASPAEMQELLAEGVITKAVDDHGLMEGQVSQDPHYIEDQWTGEPDAMPRIQRITRGASGSHPGDSMLIGNPQAASGDGATAMLREYSPAMATQAGVAEVTTRWGEMMSRMDAAAKARDAHMSRRIDLMGRILSKALADMATAKSENPFKKDEEEEDEKKEKEASKAKAAAEEKKDEEDEEKAASKLAAKAKSSLSEARRSITKGLVAFASGDTATHAAAFTSARGAVKAASLAFNGVKILSAEHADIPDIAKSFDVIAKALPRNEAENQDIWPESGFRPVGKAEDEKKEEDEMEKAIAAAKAKTVAPSIDTAALAPMLDKIAKAAEGMHMLQTDVKGLMGMFAGQSANGGGMPPVFDLAKADPTAFATAKQSEIQTALAAGVLTQSEADLAHDIAGSLRAAAMGQIGDDMPKARLRTAPPAVRNIFKQAA